MAYILSIEETYNRYDHMAPPEIQCVNSVLFYRISKKLISMEIIINNRPVLVHPYT
jgi:hypothetical protein